MSDIVEKQIHIEEASATDQIIKIIDGRAKYSFFKTKKSDGKDTKAYQQWMTYGLGVGDTVVAGVTEEPATFTNAKGQEINYTQRRIMYFKGDEHGTPEIRPSQSSLEKRVADLENRMFELESRESAPSTKADDLPF